LGGSAAVGSPVGLGEQEAGEEPEGDAHDPIIWKTAAMLAPGGRWVTGELGRVLTAIRFLGCVARFPAVALAGSRTNEGWWAVGRRWWFGTAGAQHSVRNARSLQVRFRNGEVLDNVQLRGR
jgi:hypothetical protein